MSQRTEWKKGPALSLRTPQRDLEKQDAVQFAKAQDSILINSYFLFFGM